MKSKLRIADEMLILLARYVFVFWAFFGSGDNAFVKHMEAEDRKIYKLSACIARCLLETTNTTTITTATHFTANSTYYKATDLYNSFQTQQQQQHSYHQQQNYSILENCRDECQKKNATTQLNQSFGNLTKIQENLSLSLICRDDESLNFRINYESRRKIKQINANKKISSSHVASITSATTTQEHSNETKATTVKAKQAYYPYAGMVYVIKVKEANDTDNFFVYLSDENSFTIGKLKNNKLHNITVVAVFANNKYSIIAKDEQYATITRGYIPNKVAEVEVEKFTNDDMNDKRLIAEITWKPAADMTCHYDIITFSPEKDDEFTQFEIRYPWQLYTYKLENLTFSTEYNVGIRSKNTHNISKESDLTWKAFRTPSCVEWFNYNFNICAPMQPENLRVKQTYLSEHEYSLNISWTKSQHTLDFYMLSVLDLDYRGSSYSKNISKDLSTYFLSNITLYGLAFEVHLTAYTLGGNTTTWITELTQIMVIVPDKNHIVKLLFAILAPIICIATLSLTTSIICHRRAKLKRYQERCKYFEELEKKAPIDPKAVFDFPTKSVQNLTKSEDMGQFQFDLDDKIFFNDDMEINAIDVTLHEILGEGAFGLVRRGTYNDNKLAPREVAVKMLKDQPSIDDVRAFRREIEVMKSVEKHPNIVGIIGHCTKHYNEMMLLTEYCSFGNLLDFLRDEWKFLHGLHKKIAAGKKSECTNSMQQQQQQQQHQQQTCQYKCSNNSNNSVFNIDTGHIIEKLKLKYKHLNGATLNQSQAIIEDDPTASVDNENITTNAEKRQLNFKDIPHKMSPKPIVSPTVTLRPIVASLKCTSVQSTMPTSPPTLPSTVATATPLNIKSTTTTTTTEALKLYTAAAADNKSYGYAEFCTNACKSQVNVRSKEVNSNMPHNEAQQYECILQQQQHETDAAKHLATAAKRERTIEIKNCDCSRKRLAKNNKQNSPHTVSRHKCEHERKRERERKRRKQHGNTTLLCVENKAYFKSNTVSATKVASRNAQNRRTRQENKVQIPQQQQKQLPQQKNQTIVDQNKLLPFLIKRMPLNATDLLDIARQVAVGMEFLAKNKIVHRDLAARNVLVSPDRTIKIADFGLSRDVYQENIYKKTGNGKLPIKWLALESMTHQVYTTQSDVWSYGILLYEIVTLGGTPYPAIPTNRLLHLLKTGYRMEKPRNCGQDFYNLMYSCWHVNPSERPNFSEIIKVIDDLITSSPQEQIDSALNVSIKSEKSTEEISNNGDDAYLKPL